MSNEWESKLGTLPVPERRGVWTTWDADTWDAIAAGRWEFATESRQAALRVWRNRSGTFLDPLLVGNFILMMSEIGEAPA